MKWIQRWLRRYVPPEVRVRSVVIPTHTSVTTEQLEEACEWIMVSNEGKVLLRAMKDKYFAALIERCPHLNAESRSLWQSYHDTLLGVRLEMVEMLEPLPPAPPGQGDKTRLTGMKTYEGVTDG